MTEVEIEVPTPQSKAARSLTLKGVPRAVRNILGGDTRDHKIVLAWLAHICHATDTVARGTMLETGIAIGERNVWLEIQNTLRLTEDDVRDIQEWVANYGG